MLRNAIDRLKNIGKPTNIRKPDPALSEIEKKNQSTAKIQWKNLSGFAPKSRQVSTEVPQWAILKRSHKRVRELYSIAKKKTPEKMDVYYGISGK